MAYKTGKPAMERTRQEGVSFRVDRMIAEQLTEEKRAAEEKASERGRKARAPERSRDEVYGMPVADIIESSKAAYPPVEKAAPESADGPVWTSIEDQMANPMGKKGPGRIRRR